MLTIGDQFPSFSAKAMISLAGGHKFAMRSSDSFDGK